jgi:hypothetical protein
MKSKKREYLVVYGPHCSGKTLNAEAMKKALGYDHVFDDFTPSWMIKEAEGRIILTSLTEEVRNPDDRRTYVLRKKPIEAVKRLLGAQWIEPVEGYRAPVPPMPKIKTAHELARALLAGLDLPIYHFDSSRAGMDDEVDTSVSAVVVEVVEPDSESGCNGRFITICGDYDLQEERDLFEEFGVL